MLLGLLRNWSWIDISVVYGLKEIKKLFTCQSSFVDTVSAQITPDVRLKVAASKLKDKDVPYIQRFLERWGVSWYLVKQIKLACRWKFPAVDEAMINTDGSMTNAWGGFVAIIRGSDGLPIAAAISGSVVYFVLFHELQGVELGLKLDDNLSPKSILALT